jgi:hypothetical protein
LLLVVVRTAVADEAPAPALTSSPDGGVDPATVLAEGLDGPDLLVGDEANLYFTSVRGDRLWKLPKKGGKPTQLVEGATRIVAIAVDKGAVYWADQGASTSDGTVARVAKSGGPKVVLAAKQAQPGGVAVDDKGVYWGASAGGQVLRAAKVGSAAAPVTVAAALVPLAVAVDGSGIYWTCATGQVQRTAKPGAPVVTIAAEELPARALLLDKGSLLWAASAWTTSPNNAIRRLPRGGKEPVALGTQLEPPVFNLAVDGSNVYYANGAAGTLMKVSKEGGAPKQLYARPGIRHVVVDESFIYFTNSLAGTIAKLPR